MKKITGLLFIVADLAASSIQAQTTNSPPDTNSTSIWTGLEDIGKAIYDAAPTNFLVAPYATYAPNAPSKFGGGVMAVMNVNNYVGVGVGADYLGGFSMVNASVKLQIPIKPLTFLGNSSFLTNFTVTPFALAGAATPFSGAGHANYSLASIAGGGGNIDIVLVCGGELSAGVAVINWQGAGAYSGMHYSPFIAWRHGF